MTYALLPSGADVRGERVECSVTSHQDHRAHE